MIEDPRGAIDYDEQGSGTTLVLVPGSWSTGSAWKGVVRAFAGEYLVVTTSLLGYGGSIERRTPRDTSIEREAEMIEQVLERAGEPVHLVGHSFGAHVCLAVAQRQRVELSSLAMLEATAFDALRQGGEHELYGEVVAMRDDYTRAFAAGDSEAAGRVIDFYGGPGSYAALPLRMREYVVATTATNVVDWASVFGWRVPLADFGRISVPTLVVRGADAHPCVAKAAEIVAGAMGNGRLATLANASHFMMTTHPSDVAALIDEHVAYAQPAV